MVGVVLIAANSFVMEKGFLRRFCHNLMEASDGKAAAEKAFETGSESGIEVDVDLDVAKVDRIKDQLEIRNAWLENSEKEKSGNAVWNWISKLWHRGTKTMTKQATEQAQEAADVIKAKAAAVAKAKESENYEDEPFNVFGASMTDAFMEDVELSLWPPEDEDEGVLLEEERSKMLMDLYVTFAGCTLVVLILDLWLPKKVLAAFGFINDRKI